MKLSVVKFVPVRSGLVWRVGYIYRSTLCTLPGVWFWSLSKAKAVVDELRTAQMLHLS